MPYTITYPEPMLRFEVTDNAYVKYTNRVYIKHIDFLKDNFLWFEWHLFKDVFREVIIQSIKYDIINNKGYTKLEMNKLRFLDGEYNYSNVDTYTLD